MSKNKKPKDKKIYKCKELYEFCVKGTCDEFAEKFNIYITPDGIYEKAKELIKKNGKQISCVVFTKKGPYEPNIKDKKELGNYILLNLQDTINEINRTVLYKDKRKGIFALTLTEKGFKKITKKNKNDKMLQPDNVFFKGLDKLFEQRLDAALAEAEVTVGPIMKMGYSLKQVLNPSKKIIKEVQDRLAPKEKTRPIGVISGYGSSSKKTTSDSDDDGSYSRPKKRPGDNNDYSSRGSSHRRDDSIAIYSKHGNTVYGPNGDTYARHGNVVYGPDGAYSRHGNVIYGPKDTYTISGRNTYSSNDTYSRHGNTTYSSRDSYGKHGRNVYGGRRSHYIGVSHAFDDDDEE